MLNFNANRHITHMSGRISSQPPTETKDRLRTFPPVSYLKYVNVYKAQRPFSRAQFYYVYAFPYAFTCFRCICCAVYRAYQIFRKYTAGELRLDEITP